MVSLIVAAVFAALYVYFRHRDRRLLRNGIFLLAAVWFALFAVATLLAAQSRSFGLTVVFLVALTPLAVLVLAGFAIANGVTVIRAEGLSKATALSLAAGVALVLVPVAGVLLVLTGNRWAVGLAIVLLLASGYVGVAFVGFLLYSLAYARMSHDVQPAALVVLGSRIIDGRVPPLLRSRLDRALAIYERARVDGRAPLLIPSGGQGADESRSEGEAMAEYLLAQGADPADVRAEVRARNTRENLLLSREIQQDSGRAGPVLAVTNNFHVLRAAVLARSIGSDAQVVGSPTARYYVPSAFLREFIAVVVQQRRVHVITVGAFLLMALIALVAVY